MIKKILIFALLTLNSYAFSETFEEMQEKVQSITLSHGQKGSIAFEEDILKISFKGSIVSLKAEFNKNFDTLTFSAFPFTFDVPNEPKKTLAQALNINEADCTLELVEWKTKGSKVVRAEGTLKVKDLNLTFTLKNYKLRGTLTGRCDTTPEMSNYEEKLNQFCKQVKVFEEEALINEPKLKILRRIK